MCIGCTFDECGYVKSGTVSLNKDGVVGSLYARSRREGDTVRSGGMTKKLKRIFSDRHIPSHRRGLIPVICDELGVLALPGIVARDGAYDKTNVKKEKIVITTYSRIDNSADGGIDEEKK